MNEDGNKLLENVMNALGDNPAESISQMLAAISSKSADDSSNKKEKDAQSKAGEDSGLSNLGIDPSTLLAIQGLLSQSNAPEKDERSALLAALRPFMSEDRRPQIDRAIKLLNLSKLAKTAQELNLFKELL